MPLIDVTLRPEFFFEELRFKDKPSRRTRQVVRELFGPKLPQLFVENATSFGMDPETPLSGVQVQFHDFDIDDINVPDVWVKVQFSENPPERDERADIIEAVYESLIGVFDSLEMMPPDNFMMDVFWGPTHGCGRVNGTFIEW
jgi:hypothetical protein